MPPPPWHSWQARRRVAELRESCLGLKRVALARSLAEEVLSWQRMSCSMFTTECVESTSISRLVTSTSSDTSSYSKNHWPGSEHPMDDRVIRVKRPRHPGRWHRLFGAFRPVSGRLDNRYVSVPGLVTTLNAEPNTSKQAKALEGKNEAGSSHCHWRRRYISINFRRAA